MYAQLACHISSVSGSRLGGLRYARAHSSASRMLNVRFNLVYLLKNGGKILLQGHKHISLPNMHAALLVDIYAFASLRHILRNLFLPVCVHA